MLYIIRAQPCSRTRYDVAEQNSMSDRGIKTEIQKIKTSSDQLHLQKYPKT